MEFSFYLYLLYMSDCTPKYTMCYSYYFSKCRATCKRVHTLPLKVCMYIRARLGTDMSTSATAVFNDDI